ncbi:hypothetical protein FQY92_08480 [Bordetella pertussis]
MAEPRDRRAVAQRRPTRSAAVAQKLAPARRTMACSTGRAWANSSMEHRALNWPPVSSSAGAKLISAAMAP